LQGQEDESLALARLLMEEEEREWNARMLAMAGGDKPLTLNSKP